jgi:Ran GTPase-activating protein (RanGAP) involved in mRNA processing and transport
MCSTVTCSPPLPPSPPGMSGQALQKLDLSRNTLGTVGVEVVARFLETAPALEWLSLENVGLGDAGLMALCASLIKRTVDAESGAVTCESAVRHLNLSRNGFGDSAMPALASVLAASKVCKENLCLKFKFERKMT